MSQGSGKQVSQGGDLSLFHDDQELSRAEKAEDDGHLGAATLRHPLTLPVGPWTAQTPEAKTEHPWSPLRLASSPHGGLGW